MEYKLTREEIESIILMEGRKNISIKLGEELVIDHWEDWVGPQGIILTIKKVEQCIKK